MPPWFFTKKNIFPKVTMALKGSICMLQIKGLWLPWRALKFTQVQERKERKPSPVWGGGPMNLCRCIIQRDFRVIYWGTSSFPLLGFNLRPYVLIESTQAAGCWRTESVADTWASSLTLLIAFKSPCCKDDLFIPHYWKCVMQKCT